VAGAAAGRAAADKSGDAAAQAVEKALNADAEQVRRFTLFASDFPLLVPWPLALFPCQHLC
jgi:hypothetical protein